MYYPKPVAAELVAQPRREVGDGHVLLAGQGDAGHCDERVLKFLGQLLLVRDVVRFGGPRVLQAN